MLLLAAALPWMIGISMQTRPASAELLREANESYRAMKAADAVRLYRQYLAEDSQNAAVRVYLGAALLSLNQPAQAQEEVIRALALNPQSAKAHVLLGRIYDSENSWNLAQQSFEQALKLDATDRDALYFSGRAFYDANRFQQAIGRFEQALTLGATQSRTYENLALSYAALGLSRQADDAFRSAVQLAGNQYRPYLAYGAFLFKEGRAEDSLQMLRRAFQIQPDVTDVRFELARVLYHCQQLSDAAHVLEGALGSNECRVHNLMAKILALQGEKEMARREVSLLKNCLSANSVSSPARRELGSGSQ